MFSDRLSYARMQKGMTSRAVAEALSIAPSTYSGYEHGRTEPSLDMLKQICGLLDVSADYLLGLDAKPSAFPVLRIPREPYADLTEENQQRLRDYYELLKLGQDQAKKGQRAG